MAKKASRPRISGCACSMREKTKRESCADENAGEKQHPSDMAVTLGTVDGRPFGMSPS